VLALAVATLLSLAPRSTSFAAPVLMMARPSVVDRADVDDHDDENARKAAADEDVRRESKRGAQAVNATLLGQPRRFASDEMEVTQADWATCFVEASEQGKPVLEEWIMRSQRSNVDVFQSWRATQGSTVSVRCTASSSAVQPQEVTCLECLSHEREFQLASPSALSASGGIPVQADVVSTFSALDQCMATTLDGNGFCKTGKVTMPR